MILHIPSREFYDEGKEEFVYSKEYKIKIKHSLVSVTKWEERWLKPFMTDIKKTIEESKDYIKCMTITQNIPDDAYDSITDELIEKVNDYIEHPMTATTIRNTETNKINRDIITAELIYYYMVSLNIPFECQKWHFNKLITLIHVCNIKNSKPKTMTQQEARDRNRILNRQRREKYKTKG